MGSRLSEPEPASRRLPDWSDPELEPAFMPRSSSSEPLPLPLRFELRSLSLSFAMVRFLQQIVT
ncbi:MAG: hypothetical protein H0X64_06010 [Gemmatimonadaceae bacterium]|nr:hypothetical protein [Gemmatimonadaceae bacterium]